MGLRSVPTERFSAPAHRPTIPIPERVRGEVCRNKITSEQTLTKSRNARRSGTHSRHKDCQVSARAHGSLPVTHNAVLTGPQTPRSGHTFLHHLCPQTWDEGK